MIIKSADFVTSAVTTNQMPLETRVEFVFCGRSNVGKSSFINMLLNRKKLAYTSQNPGKTQTLNIYSVNDNIYFVDVPGYGYANVSKKTREQFGVMIEDYLKNRRALKMAFLLVDFRHQPTQDDKAMFDYFRYYDIPVTVIATKADKVKKSEIVKNIKMIKHFLEITEFDRFIVTSNQTRLGYDEVLDVIEEITNKGL